MLFEINCLLLLSCVVSIHCYVDIDVKDCTLTCGDDYKNKLFDSSGSFSKSEVAKVRQMITEFKRNQGFCPQIAYLFPRRSTDYIRVKSPLAPINKLTICTWAKIYGTGTFWGTIVSYATPSDFNNFLIIFDYKGNEKLYISALGEIKREIDHPLTKGPEHFICFAVDRSAGFLKVYYNGTMNRKIDFSNKDPIPSGGAFIIGQEQDSYLGGFELDQAIHGEIRNYMVWERVLTDKEIAKMFQSKCSCARNYSLALTKDNVQLEGGVNALHMDQRCH